jgi:hypothetical protein
MSTNWDKYSDPDDTRSRCKEPHRNAVISLPVDGVRREANQAVEHTPDPLPTPDPERPWLRPNRAHTEVIGSKDNEARTLLRRMCKVELGLG